MTVRKLIPLAVTLGLWIAGSAAAQDETAAAKARNQKLADSVAEYLRSSGVIKGATVNIETRDGIVDLTGTAQNEQQHEEILRALTKMKGIRKIQSWIMVDGAAKRSDRAGPGAAYNSVRRTGGQMEGGTGPAPGPVSALPPPIGAVPFNTSEPVPLNGAPAMAPLDPSGPRLPPYAWPTYAPYNNMSRVAYPQTYPYNAFPYIGPYYPFPKVPLGWRKVVLEFDDGHWYYGRLASPHDFWRVKFW